MASGRAGEEGLSMLVNDLGVLPDNIRIITYDREDNKGLIGKAEKLGIPCSVDKTDPSGQFEVASAFKPDLIVSMHFRDLIPLKVIEVAPLGGFNLHPSLLPKYRGCFSGVWAIIEGEEQTGVTYHYLNESFDDGLVILQKEIDIAPDETGYSIFNKLIDLGLKHFVEAFLLVTEKRIRGARQKGKPSYHGRKVPFGGIIDSRWDENKVDAFIRAMYFPGHKGALVKTESGLEEVKTMEEYIVLKEGGLVV